MSMLEYDFMRNAFAASAIVAIVAGLVGYFLVLRGQTFAGHALAHVGFTGATGAVLVGIAPLWGLVSLTVAAGIAMGAMGERLTQRDVAIGIILALSLGLGLLFLHFFTAYATQATALLFGNVLAVDDGTVWTLLGLGIVCVVMLAVISRPLLFASLQPEVAEARGVSLRRYAILFAAIVALATSECVQIVGVLLVFALMVGPAAAAQQLVDRIRTRAIPIRCARAAGGLGRDRPCLLYRLAQQLLDHGFERRGLLFNDRLACRSGPQRARARGIRLGQDGLVETVKHAAVLIVAQHTERTTHRQRLVAYVNRLLGMHGDDRGEPARHAERTMRLICGQQKAIQRVVILKHHHVPFDDHSVAVQLRDGRREFRLLAVHNLDLRKISPRNNPPARRDCADQRR